MRAGLCSTLLWRYAQDLNLEVPSYKDGAVPIEPAYQRRQCSRDTRDFFFFHQRSAPERKSTAIISTTMKGPGAKKSLEAHFPVRLWVKPKLQGAMQSHDPGGPFGGARRAVHLGASLRYESPVRMGGLTNRGSGGIE